MKTINKEFIKNVESDAEVTFDIRNKIIIFKNNEKEVILSKDEYDFMNSIFYDIKTFYGNEEIMKHYNIYGRK